MLESVFVNSVEKRDSLIEILKRQKRYAGNDSIYKTIFDDMREISGYIVWYRVRKGF